MQSIDLHIQQVNEDRYASLGTIILAPYAMDLLSNISTLSGTFLLQNYKQALSIQLDVGQELWAYKAETGFGTAEFLRWHQEEMDFLSTAKRKEPDELALKVSYVNALETFFTIRYVLHF